MQFDGKGDLSHLSDLLARATRDIGFDLTTDQPFRLEWDYDRREVRLTIRPLDAGTAR